MADNKLSHIDDAGRARMVDVGAKGISQRSARARAAVHFSKETLTIARAGNLKKGDLLRVAELAGIMAAKRTADLIPLCHPLQLTHVEVNVEFCDEPCGVELEALVQCDGKTGVEMEALTAVSVAALTVYDMLKAVEKTARITDVRLVEKHGGRSGDLVLE